MLFQQHTRTYRGIFRGSVRTKHRVRDKPYTELCSKKPHMCGCATVDVTLEPEEFLDFYYCNREVSELGTVLFRRQLGIHQREGN